MTDYTTKRFDLLLLVYGGMSALVETLPTLIFGNDMDTFLLSVVIAALVSLVLLIVAIRKVRSQSLATASMLLVFCATSWELFKTSNEIRYAGRWAVGSRHYKSAVLSQPDDPNGNFKHIEWDGWGFAGAGDTTVYLVFDPTDSLKRAAKNRSSGKFTGLPCEIVRAQRLEDHWYSVLFYTDTTWDLCGEPSHN